MNISKNFQIFKRIAGMFIKTSPLYAAGIVFINVAAGVIPGLLTLLWKKFYEELFVHNISEPVTQTIVFVGTAVLLFTMVSKLLQTASTVITRLMLEVIRIKLTGQVHETVSKMPVEEYENHTLYNSISRAYTIINNNRVTWLIERVILVFKSCVSVVTTVSVLVSFHIVLLPLCILSILPPVIARIIRGKEYYELKLRQTSDSRKVEYYYSLYTDRYTNRELRIHNAFPVIYHKWAETCKKLQKEDNDFYSREGKIKILVDSSEILGLTAGIALCAVMSLNNVFSVGTLSAAITAIESVQNIFTSILITLGDINNGFRELNELLELLDGYQVPEREELTSCGVFENIRTDAISYVYPGTEKNTLNNVSLDIQKNESIAIVGGNGAGKTTLIKLLLKLYHPSEGGIFFNDTELDSIEDNSYYSNFSVIFQDYVRYSLKFSDNVALCREKDSDRIMNVLGTLDDAVLKETPLDAMVGVEYGGTDFSGGQWQKIAFARALYRGRDIIVLDEPTASMDPLAEVELFKNIMKLKEDKTLIFITHRIGSARLADRILVIDEGNIIETGSHDELMAENGVYAEMFKAQAQWYV